MLPPSFHAALTFDLRKGGKKANGSSINRGKRNIRAQDAADFSTFISFVELVCDVSCSCNCARWSLPRFLFCLMWYSQFFGGFFWLLQIKAKLWRWRILWKPHVWGENILLVINRKEMCNSEIIKSYNIRSKYLRKKRFSAFNKQVSW